MRIKEATLSSKGQITVPKQIRELLDVKCGDNIAFYIEEGDVKLTNVKNLNIEPVEENKSVNVRKV